MLFIKYEYIPVFISRNVLSNIIVMLFYVFNERDMKLQGWYFLVTICVKRWRRVTRRFYMFSFVYILFFF